MNNKNNRFWWKDQKGLLHSGGGLLIYDDNGIWVISETKNQGSKQEYTDIGGRYRFEDCDIYQTIAREFEEETYHTSTIELRRTKVIKLYDKYKFTYVYGQISKKKSGVGRGIPVYGCIVVPIKEFNISGFDNEYFMKERSLAIKSNPNVPENFYKSIEIRHITFREIWSGKLNFSHRLNKILLYNFVLNKKIQSENKLNKIVLNTIDIKNLRITDCDR